MPTYEYLCKKCGMRFDIVQSFKDRPLKRHDECGGELQKIFHASGVVFKGSGFYVTDSRSSSAKAASGNGSSKEKAAPEQKKESSEGSKSSDGSSSSED